MGASVPDDFERMWADLRRSGGRRGAAATSASRSPAPSASCDAWFVEQAAAPRAAARDRRLRQPDRLVVRDPRDGTGSADAGRADRLAPGLGARRRGVRRAARRGLRAGGGRRAARRAGSCRRGRSGCRCSSRRRGRASGWPASGRGWRPARPRGRRPAGCATGTAYALDEAMARPGSRPRIPSPGWDLSASACFVELHVEQGRDLVDRGAAIGVASRIWPHGRYRFDFAGEPNHAGTTRMEDRQRPDADLRDDGAGGQQAGAARRAAGDVRPGRDARRTRPTRCRRR